MKMVINVFLAPAYFSVLLLSYFGANAFLPTFRSSYQLSYKKDPLYRPLQQTEPDEFFNENDDILSGDPIWFNPSAQRDISTTILEKGIIDNNVILRSLPLYLLHDGQCFPTGSLSMRIDNQYTTMMTDIEKTDKMFGVVFSDGKGQFCEIGTAVENIKQEFYRGGGQQLQNICRQRFRILKIIQVEPYLIADVEYGISDLDVLKAESTVQELPDSICFLEREIYQILFDVINLTNKIFEEENSVDRNSSVLEISRAVKLLSPQNHFFRLSVATDFSFAVCDMIGASTRLKQILLETTSLELRLNMIKKALINARSYLIDTIDAYEEPFN